MDLLKQFNNLKKITETSKEEDEPEQVLWLNSDVLESNISFPTSFDGIRSYDQSSPAKAPNSRNQPMIKKISPVHLPNPALHPPSEPDPSKHSTLNNPYPTPIIEVSRINNRSFKNSQPRAYGIVHGFPKQQSAIYQNLPPRSIVNLHIRPGLGEEYLIRNNEKAVKILLDGYHDQAIAHFSSKYAPLTITPL